MTAINELEVSRAARALRNAYALGEDAAPLLTERRQALANELERHVDTVESHENQAIDELVLLLEREATVLTSVPRSPSSDDQTERSRAGGETWVVRDRRIVKIIEGGTMIAFEDGTMKTARNNVWEPKTKRADQKQFVIWRATEDFANGAYHLAVEFEGVEPSWTRGYKNVPLIQWISGLATPTPLTGSRRTRNLNIDRGEVRPGTYSIIEWGFATVLVDE